MKIYKPKILPSIDNPILSLSAHTRTKKRLSDETLKFYIKAKKPFQQKQLKKKVVHGYVVKRDLSDIDSESSGYNYEYPYEPREY